MRKDELRKWIHPGSGHFSAVPSEDDFRRAGARFWQIRADKQPSKSPDRWRHVFAGILAEQCFKTFAYSLGFSYLNEDEDQGRKSADYFDYELQLFIDIKCSEYVPRHLLQDRVYIKAIFDQDPNLWWIFGPDARGATLCGKCGARTGRKSYPRVLYVGFQHGRALAEGFALLRSMADLRTCLEEKRCRIVAASTTTSSAASAAPTNGAPRTASTPDAAGGEFGS